MKHSILFMNLLEPLHCGAGEGLGGIDRPIIRETPTAFPIIQPPTIKGVLRRSFETIWSGPPESSYVLELFGPKPGRGAEHAGAISFGEGQMLAFPVRSLRGLFVWATCPRVLFRLQHRLALTSKKRLASLDDLLRVLVEKGEYFSPVVTPSLKDAALVHGRSTETNHLGDLILEEYHYAVEEMARLEVFAKEISKDIYGGDSFWSREFSRKLVVLPEDSFRHFAVNCTELMPNIQITEYGVTEPHSLRYTEYLPRESVLYSLISYAGSRMPVAGTGAKSPLGSPEEVQAVFERHKPDMIQIGGDETTGKGLVALRIMKATRARRKRSGES